MAGLDPAIHCFEMQKRRGCPLKAEHDDAL
jgi:hypothetical protein